MSIIKPASLGIIACPGAEQFTSDVIRHLKRQYVKKYHKLASDLSAKYSMTTEEVWKRMNLIEDLHRLEDDPRKRPVDRFRPPEFRLPVRFTRFANGEFKSELLSSVKGMSVFIIQDVENHYPLSFYNSEELVRLSVNDHVMMLFTTIDAALEAGAESVTLVLPTYPYSRQHKKRGREALTARWFGQMCEHSGASRIITVDIHSKEIENTFNKLILENLHGSYQIIRALKDLVDLSDPDLVVVSPDTGAVDRNKFYAGNLKKPLALLYKERDYSRVSRDASSSNITNIRLLGDVTGKIVFMADDMLGTGGTLMKAMRELKRLGARQIIAAASLPFFTGDAVDHFDQAYKEGIFYRIIGTNAVYHDAMLLDREWYISADITDLHARIISRLHHGRSLSPLLENSRIIQKLLRKE
ncbi:ribose-phosphate pyrophosphokinase [Sediminispirochaeta bajacaliforniensis]|uniref:ribose-phosphate pyrophosphokinase n=1 Tax=Sediminispirochaeta bajacaliforniensis TaxID=148 RepID=UPI000476A391|nr:ribose-phosphate pyrophosphokinase [Sediminispirochaeta bajacaliforniensis]